MAANSSCACTGIRKCALCSPNLVQSELIQDQIVGKNSFLFCIKCNQAIRIENNFDKIQLENFLYDQNAKEFKCNCHNISEKDCIKINGLQILNEFLSFDQEKFLLEEINKTKWVDSQSGKLIFKKF